MKYSVENLTRFLTKEGIEIVKVIHSKKVLCKQFQESFFVVYSMDFYGMRWQCNIAHVDKLLRQWQK
jgi:hypothetical protein